MVRVPRTSGINGLRAIRSSEKSRTLPDLVPRVNLGRKDSICSHELFAFMGPCSGSQRKLTLVPIFLPKARVQGQAGSCYLGTVTEDQESERKNAVAVTSISPPCTM